MDATRGIKGLRYHLSYTVNKSRGKVGAPYSIHRRNLYGVPVNTIMIWLAIRVNSGDRHLLNSVTFVSDVRWALAHAEWPQRETAWAEAHPTNCHY